MKTHHMFIKVSLAAAMVLASPGFAGNGAHFMSVSPVSGGMGGTSVGHFAATTDALLRNAANLSLLPRSEPGLTVELDFHLAKVNASATSTATAVFNTSGAVNSSSGVQAIPELGLAYRLNKDFVFGLGVMTYGGASSNYVGNQALLQLKLDNALFRIAPAVAWRFTDHFQVGVSPFLTYGELSINLADPPVTGTQTTRTKHGATGFGVQVGVTTDILDPVTVGVALITRSTLTYSSVIDLDAFGSGAGTNTGLDSLTSDQPAEWALGVAWRATPELKLAADYRFIGWGDTTGYSKLRWHNQHVIALGGEYRLGDVALRAGFNYGASPVDDVTGETESPEANIDGHLVYPRSISQLNMIAFPAIAQTHITAGAGWYVNPSLELSLSTVYVFQNTRTRSGSNPSAPGTGGALTTYTFTGAVSQWSISAGASYNF